MLPSARLRSLIDAILCPFRVDTVNIHSTTGHFAPLVALLCLARVSAVCGMFLLFLKLAWSGFKSLSGHQQLFSLLIGDIRLSPARVLAMAPSFVGLLWPSDLLLRLFGEL